MHHVDCLPGGSALILPGSQTQGNHLHPELLDRTLSLISCGSEDLMNSKVSYGRSWRRSCLIKKMTCVVREGQRGKEGCVTHTCGYWKCWLILLWALLVTRIQTNARWTVLDLLKCIFIGHFLRPVRTYDYSTSLKINTLVGSFTLLCCKLPRISRQKEIEGDDIRRQKRKERELPWVEACGALSHDLSQC